MHSLSFELPSDPKYDYFVRIEVLMANLKEETKPQNADGERRWSCYPEGVLPACYKIKFFRSSTFIKYT